jgi:hypothetical protein
MKWMFCAICSSIDVVRDGRCCFPQLPADRSVVPLSLRSTAHLKRNTSPVQQQYLLLCLLGLVLNESGRGTFRVLGTVVQLASPVQCITSIKQRRGAISTSKGRFIGTRRAEHLASPTLVLRCFSP